MTDERCSKITIGGKEYELLLTTRATKEIGKKYGGLSDLGDKLLKAENFEAAMMNHLACYTAQSADSDSPRKESAG